MASQMTDARLDRTTVDLSARFDDTGHTFTAKGTVVRFPGFMKAYGESRKDQILPRLEEGDRIHAAGRGVAAPALPDAPGDSHTAVVLRSVEPDRRETKPPSRYTEASLIRKLEEEGIGRPSTYTPTISTIQERDYVRKRGGSLVPTYTGMAVNQLLRAHFEKYVDIGFTARMEDSLDDIATGQVDSERFLRDFYNGEGKRAGLAREIEERLPEIGYPAVTVGDDPDTGQPIRIRIGRNSVYAERGDGEGVARATIPGDLLIDELTLERVTELLNRQPDAEEPIGTDPATGLPVFIKVGQYGPYVQLGTAKPGKKPRWVGLPQGMEPADVTLEYALRLLALPRVLGRDPGSGEEIRAGLGRYGPYVQRAREFRNLQSADQVFTVTLDEALDLLARKQVARRAGRKVLKELGLHPESGLEVRLLEGRYGPYVTDGTTNASIPRGQDPAEATMDQAVQLLASAAQRKKTRRTRGRRRASAARR